MDRKNVCEKRKNIYTLLAYLLLNEPSQELVKVLDENKEWMREIANDKSLFTESLNDMDLESFIQEYYDRFFVNTSGKFIPPFEYAVRGRMEKDGKTHFGKLLNKRSFHVADCYASVGFAIDSVDMFRPLREMQQYPDHIAYEMSFMVYLLNGEEKALLIDEEDANAWQSRQYQFLSEHLGIWVSDLSDLMKAEAEGIYTEIMQVIKNWIQGDLQYLASKKSN